MKFKITRTSNWGYSSPCEEAKEIIDGKLKIYKIEIKDLEDLCSFVKHYGPIIIEESDDSEFEIEIYDDYRE